MKPTVLIIGAGIGGIATAARLAKNGFEVTVVEKNDQPGGRCGQFIRDGHRFDIGPTLFLMPEVWEETFTALGERMSDHLDLRRIDPTYKVHFEDGLQLALTSNLGAMQTQLERVKRPPLPASCTILRRAANITKFPWRDLLGAISTACWSISRPPISPCSSNSRRWSNTTTM